MSLEPEKCLKNASFGQTVLGNIYRTLRIKKKKEAYNSLQFLD